MNYNTMVKKLKKDKISTRLWVATNNALCGKYEQSFEPVLCSCQLNAIYHGREVDISYIDRKTTSANKSASITHSVQFTDVEHLFFFEEQEEAIKFHKSCLLKNISRLKKQQVRDKKEILATCKELEKIKKVSERVEFTPPSYQTEEDAKEEDFWLKGNVPVSAEDKKEEEILETTIEKTKSRSFVFNGTPTPTTPRKFVYSKPKEENQARVGN